ncbi:MAG TPA: PASTA domain-containing protein [Solirubrobacteraceae bacterium]|nr:PASTA domain-containing protein [Solirubrobacteraceae bacterium]
MGSVGLVLVALAVAAILLDRAVPTVTGLTVRQAETKLHGFDLHARTDHPYTPGSLVCGQHPVAGQTVIEGASVTLYAHHDCQ